MTSITVQDFKYIEGQNDAEYIKLLKKELEKQTELTFKVIAKIKELSKQKQGKWLWKLADNGWKDIYCSECGWIKNVDIHVSLNYNYCPNCGIIMKGEGNSNA